MNISRYNISLSGTSNFPIIPKDCIANRTRSKDRKIVLPFDVKRNVRDATTYFKKIVWLDQNYPPLINMRDKKITVNVPTAEIWVGRVALAISVVLTGMQSL